MDDTMRKANGEYIWLRYTTQYMHDGRTQTIEIDVPVPIGASAETREQLLREAEAGMDQLTQHIEERIARQPRRSQAPLVGPAQPAIPIPSPAVTEQPPIVAPSAPVRSAEKTEPPAPVTRPPAPVVPASTATMRSSQPAAKEEVVVPPTRDSIGASMPSAPTGTNDAIGNLTLPDFINHIKSMGLSPQQAMNKLKVKSLGGGINLREALKQLQHLMAQEADHPGNLGEMSRVSSPSTAQAPQKSAENRNATPSAPSVQPTIVSTPSTPPSAQRTAPQKNDAEEHAVNIVREDRPVYVFVEEVEPGEGDDLNYALDELEDLEGESSAGLKPHERLRAENRLSSLREHRGTTTASPARLQALHNVVDSQISSQQLQTLIQGVWGVTTPKRLKIDQLEALVSWAMRDDDFVNDVELLLELLEEDSHARGNR